ncbi:MAG: (Fe-S)-binding protein [Chloroherpetonaceae bacterium]|nr:(Fe-S)-binding protein [Chloroherpetonaceae bacterium]
MTTEVKSLSNANPHALASLTDNTLLNCMQCGFCLPHCPTYSLDPLEKYSPRGRIQLTRLLYEQSSDIHSANLLEPNSEAIQLSNEISESIHSCLGCLACQTACPAGVEYESIFEAAKNLLQSEEMKQQKLKSILIALGLKIIATPWLLTVFSKILFFLQETSLSRHLPLSLMRSWNLSPKFSEQPFHQSVKTDVPKSSNPNKVRLFTGCIMNHAFYQEHLATLQLLQSHGFEVIISRESLCCGALHAHNGFGEEGKQLAQKIFKLSSEGIPLIVNSAGCGSWLKHSLDKMNSTREGAEITPRNPKVYDLSEFLFQTGFSPQLPKLKERIAYQDACHLEHGQKIKKEPRQLLSLVFENLIELSSPECCGSAGIYNLTESLRSEQLLERKINALRALNLDYVTTANPGCLLQLRYGIQKYHLKTKAIHISEALLMGLKKK